MLAAKIVSLQESTTGAVSDFLEQEGCDCINSLKLLSYLAGALQRYEEEGVVLSPRVVLCANLDFIQRLPGGKTVVVGTGRYDTDSGKTILKNCATLAQDGWSIFVERASTGDTIKYGIFSYSESPTSIDLRDVISLTSPDPAITSHFLILVERTDPKTVSLNGARGNILRVVFSTTRLPISDINAIDNFARVCTSSGVDISFQRYFSRLLQSLLNESHGTILTCRKLNDRRRIASLRDAIVLDPPLDIALAFKGYVTTSTADSILELKRTEALLRGMIRSDGIVTFDTAGRVTAYRMFYREASKRGATRTKATATAPNGGARRRAFEGLRPLVGTKLASALFRSQDGLTIAEVPDHG